MYSLPLLCSVDTDTPYDLEKENHIEALYSCAKKKPEDLVELQKGRRNNGNAHFLTLKICYFKNRYTM